MRKPENNLVSKKRDSGHYTWPASQPSHVPLLWIVVSDMDVSDALERIAIVFETRVYVQVAIHALSCISICVSSVALFELEILWERNAISLAMGDRA
eukprot:6491954-Amphidinium_carterae.1